jgi:AmmeMemoRadiSam system protein B
MAMIERILERDAEGFFRLILEEKDRRNVCGVPAIYALLRILDAGKSRLIRYDQAVDPSTQSVVTFMGAAFYD